MSLTIKTNIASLIAQSSLTNSTNKLNQAIERMTTGYKINHASDNAANYSISTNMTTKINAYQVAEDNVSMGLDMLATAEDSLNQITNNLVQLRKLTVASMNGIYGKKSLIAVKSEAESLLSNIVQTYKNTQYNNIRLFDVNDKEEIDETKKVANQTSFVAGETYYITNSKDLLALQDLVNSGVDTAKVNFELTSDINMSGVSFRGIGVSDQYKFQGNFDGKGHIISNLRIETTEDYVGLFGYADSATIKNIGLENCNIKGSKYTGGLAGKTYKTTTSNSYAKGTVSGTYFVGGVIGSADASNEKSLYFVGSTVSTGEYVGGVLGCAGKGGTFSNCYSEGTVQGSIAVGGLVGANFDSVTLRNSFSKCDVTGINNVGGFVGGVGSGVANSFSTGKVTGKNNVGGFAGWTELLTMASCACEINSAKVAFVGKSQSTVDMLTLDEIYARYTPESMGFTAENGWKVEGDKLVLDWQKSEYDGLNGQNEVSLQAGINAEGCSGIGFDISFELGDIGDILKNGLDNPDTLDKIDEMLNMLTNKATEYGTVQNRLMSVLDEISIKYENLVSSRSTLLDADIADVSSDYIKMQILQNASATLMTTANQSPALALQLL